MTKSTVSELPLVHPSNKLSYMDFLKTEHLDLFNKFEELFKQNQLRTVMQEALQQPVKQRLAIADSILWNEYLVVNKESEADVLELFEFMRYLLVRFKLRPDAAIYFINPTVRAQAQELKAQNLTLLPGLKSLSRQGLNFKLDFLKKAEKVAEVKVSEDGYALPGYLSESFDRAYSTTGAPPQKKGFVVIDNRKARAAAGKVPEGSGAVEYNDYLDALCGIVDLTPPTIKAESNCGLPLLLPGRAIKTILILNCMVRFDFLNRCVAADQEKGEENLWEELLTHFEQLPLCIEGVRRMSDSSKRRPIFNPSGDEIGHMEKELNVEGLPKPLLKHFHSYRPRSVWSMPAGLNYIVSLLHYGTQNVYKRIFPLTFAHTTNAELDKKLLIAQQRHAKDPVIKSLSRPNVQHISVQGADISQFDGFYPFKLKEALYSKLKGNSDVLLLVELANKVQSFYCKFDDDSFKGFCYTGAVSDSGKLDKLGFAGLSSGTGIVTRNGKDGCVVVYITAKEIAGDSHSFEHLVKFLRWELEYMALNAGDDNELLASGDSVEKFRQAFERQLKSQTDWDLAPESGQKFIGQVVELDPLTGDLSFKPNFSGFINNLLAPERGIGSGSRRFWAIGVKARLALYRQDPLFNRIWTLFKDVWYEHFSSSVEEIIEQEAKEQEYELSKLADSSEIAYSSDLEDVIGAALLHSDDPFLREIGLDVVRDPNVLRYKYDLNDLSKKLGLEDVVVEFVMPQKLCDKVFGKAYNYDPFVGDEAPFAPKGSLWVLRDLEESRKDILLKLLKESANDR